VKDPEWPSGKAGVEYYFIEDDGGMFKVTYLYEPYFYIATKVGLVILPWDSSYAIKLGWHRDDC
jgi:hypothetical protein